MLTLCFTYAAEIDKTEARAGMKNEKAAEKSGTTWKDLLKTLITTSVVISAILGGIITLINNFMISPIISYTYGDTRDSFSVQADFRSVFMRLYPQMLICYGQDVILVTHLSGYYETELVYFTDGVGCADKINQNYCSGLMNQIRIGVLERLRESYGEEAVKEMEQQLSIYVSLLGGVQYENRLGNEVKRYCIIEQNGLVQDYKDDDEEIVQRLYENETVLGENLVPMNENIQISQMVETVTEEISELYESDRGSNS